MTILPSQQPSRKTGSGAPVLASWRPAAGLAHGARPAPAGGAERHDRQVSQEPKMTVCRHCTRRRARCALRARRLLPAAACCASRPRRCSALADALDERFERCVEQLAATRGRVVVTGMGKSGHVGRKIAATFASTGTPALYVHPAEASHGDLGMITADDVVLALSNSGETPELADIVAYTRRFSIPLLAIVGRADSSLADTADLALVLPQRPEACPMGLAPTTSTTAMLALGDALAVALLERRGFGTPGLQPAASRRQARQEAGAGRAADASPAPTCRWSGCEAPMTEVHARDDRQAARLRRRAQRPRRARRHHHRRRSAPPHGRPICSSAARSRS